MNLYVTRHGETEWNAKDLVCGRTDLDLTEKGRKQAQTLGEKLTEIPIDAIFVSPLKRAQETCRIAESIRNDLLNIRAEEAGTRRVSKRPPIYTEPRLIEQCYGIYEGKSRFDEGFLNNKKMFACRYPEGESQMQTAFRVYGFLEEIKKRYAEKNVLFVCHGGICRIIHTYFNDVTNDEFFQYGMGNCEIRQYEM